MAKKKDKPQTIVTGAGSGIGKATALRFHEAGYSVCCLDINLIGARETLQEINNDGMALKLDVTKAHQVKMVCNKLLNSFSQPSVLVNSAGISPDPQPVHLYELEEWKRVIDINLNGTFYCTREFVREMMFFISSLSQL